MAVHSFLGFHSLAHSLGDRLMRCQAVAKLPRRWNDDDSVSPCCSRIGFPFAAGFDMEER